MRNNTFSSKHRRRLVYLLLALAIFLTSLPIAAKKTEAPDISDTINTTDLALAYQTVIPNMLQALEEFPEYLGLEASDVEDLSLTASFTIPILRDGDLLPNDSIVYLLVHSATHYVATLSLHKVNGDLGASIEVSMAQAINSYLSDDHEANFSLFTYVQDNIMLINSDSKVHLLSYNPNVTSERALNQARDQVTQSLDYTALETYLSHPNKMASISTSAIRDLYSEEAHNAANEYYKYGTAPSYELLQIIQQVEQEDLR